MFYIFFQDKHTYNLSALLMRHKESHRFQSSQKNHGVYLRHFNFAIFSVFNLNSVKSTKFLY